MSETNDFNHKEQLNNDKNNIPTLYSHSPPPLQENSDDDDDENKKSFGLNMNQMSHSLASSNSSLPKFSMPSPNNQESTSQQQPPFEQDLNKLNDLDKEWSNDFTPFSTDNQEETDSNWANFEFSSSCVDNNPICTNDTPINTNKIEDDTKPTEFNSNIDDQDDEWGNFVEIEQVSNTNNTNTNSNIEIVDDTIINRLKETVSTNLVDYDLVINELFKSRNFKFFNDDYNDLIVNNLVIETDELWQQIQTFTTINDASNSLQFKWCLSNLEDNYLNALSLERIITRTNRTLSPQAILQPVKVEQSSIKSNVSKSEFQTNLSNSNTSDLLTTPALNLDLSFFESKELVNSNNTNNNSNNKSNVKQQNSHSSNANSKPDSKVYLDKLLEEIFTNDTKKSKAINKENGQQQQQQHHQQDDLFSDKKSLSSSSISSSSSSNLNDLVNNNQSARLSPSLFNNTTKNNLMPILQLQPQLLECQQIQSNREYDEKALNLVSKLSSVSFKNPQVIVLPR